MSANGMTQQDFDKISGDTWRAAAVEARRRAAVALCDGGASLPDVQDWEAKARRFDKNAYIADQRPRHG